MAILILVAALPVDPVRADQNAIDSARIHVVQIANELSAIPLNDSDYEHLLAAVESLKTDIGELSPQMNQVKSAESLKMDVEELSDVMALWLYGRQHNPFPQMLDGFSSLCCLPLTRCTISQRSIAIKTLLLRCHRAGCILVRL